MAVTGDSITMRVLSPSLRFRWAPNISSIRRVSLLRWASGGSNRRLYHYESLEPFSEVQVDTKHLLDKKSLPPEVYKHLKGHGLPRYEWNFMDMATRARFTAYSYELSAASGLCLSLWYCSD